jgi:hypothetical protein
MKPHRTGVSRFKTSHRRSIAWIPEQWKQYAARGILGYVTHRAYAIPDGRTYHWESRRHRKGRGGLIQSDGQTTPASPRVRMRWWGWEPRNLTWWIAIIFTVGSALLVIGSLGPFMPNRIAHAATFSVLGSACFTIANYLSLLEIINADRRSRLEINRLVHSTAATSEIPAFRWWAWMPHELSYMATFVMFAGGLLFKLCYVFGVLKWSNWIEVDILINVPGLIGSLCFLLASYLYVVEIVHKAWGFRLKSISWWSAFTCLLGSLGYTISGIYGLFGQGPIVVEQKWGNYLAVFLGAVFFLISSYLMVPEALDHPADHCRDASS